MPLYYVNVPQNDDVLNNNNIYNFICWKLLNLEVIYNQSDTNKIKDLKIINNHFQIGRELKFFYIKFTTNEVLYISFTQKMVDIYWMNG